MSQQIAVLQEQVNGLYHGMNDLRAQLGAGAISVQQPGQQLDPMLQSPFNHQQSFSGSQATPGPSLPPMSPEAMRPKSHSQGASQQRFRGPTSSDFNFVVAKNSLQAMGITSQNEAEEGGASGGPATREQTPDGAPPSHQVRKDWHRDKDPIWSIEQEEAVRLCRVFEDEMGLMYPFLNIDKLVDYTRRLYRFLEAAHRQGLMQRGLPGADAIDDDDANILKMTIACALITEGAGKSDMGKRIFDYVHPSIDTLLLGNVGTQGIRLLILTVSVINHDNHMPG